MKVAERTLAAVHVSELAAFAEEADPATETEEEALAALVEPYQRALDGGWRASTPTDGCDRWRDRRRPHARSSGRD